MLIVSIPTCCWLRYIEVGSSLVIAQLVGIPVRLLGILYDMSMVRLGLEKGGACQ